MSHQLKRFALTAIAVAVLCPLALARAAESATSGSAWSPTEYQSAYASYRRFEEAGVGNWRPLNEAVAATGGHAGAMKDEGNAAHQGSPGDAASAKPGDEPASGAASRHGVPGTPETPAPASRASRGSAQQAGKEKPGSDREHSGRGHAH